MHAHPVPCTFPALAERSCLLGGQLVCTFRFPPTTGLPWISTCSLKQDSTPTWARPCGMDCVLDLFSLLIFYFLEKSLRSTHGVHMTAPLIHGRLQFKPLSMFAAQIRHLLVTNFRFWINLPMAPGLQHHYRRAVTGAPPWGEGVFSEMKLNCAGGGDCINRTSVPGEQPLWGTPRGGAPDASIYCSAQPSTCGQDVVSSTRWRR